MKQSVALSLILALSMVAPGVSLAQSGAMKDMDMKGMDMKGMDMKGMESGKTAQGTLHKGVGTVKKIDPAKATVTLAHEPIKSVKWPAMTMGFTVKDKMLLDKLAVDKKVEFEFVQQGKDNVITSIK